MIKILVKTMPLLMLLTSSVRLVHSDEPASSNAVPEAKKILDYLHQLPGRYDHRVVAGKQLDQGNGTEPLPAESLPGSDGVATERFAMIGMDYGFPKDAIPDMSPYNRNLINRLLLNSWKAGGLIMVNFHAKNPWTGGSAWDTNSNDLKELVLAGTAANASWIRELDSTAEALSKLRDAGVVVLWRPFHGMNSTSYWWGRREGEAFNREGFVNLWRHMFDYFTKTKKLNNLLWVYSASSRDHKKMSASAYFPGKDYCDVVGLECRSGDIILDGYNEMVQLGKPFGVTEFRPSPEEPEKIDHEKLISRIKFWYPLTTFFLTAGSNGYGAPTQNGVGFLKDPWIISREELDWKAPGRQRWKQSNRLALNKIEVLTRDPACWKRVDIRVDLAAAFDTPFDSQQIEVNGYFVTPSGRKLTVPGFFDQPFERHMWGGGRFSEEVLVEAGLPEWRLRFTPVEPGEYSFRIDARDRSGEIGSPEVKFSTRAAPGSGFIRISSRSPNYFEFDDGTPFFAIGMNIVEHPLSEYFRYIPRLAQNGGNFSRLWIGFEYFALEYGPMGGYRLDNAWRLDQVMELSERYGIYQKLCVDWIRHITPRGEPRKSFDSEEYAYSISNGGPCRDMRDFFTLPEARRLFKNRLRYIVARWAYSPSVMAWELWNEIDLVDPKARDAAIIAPWNREMCRYLKSIDPWQHLTTNSLAGRDQWKAVWPMEENQFAQRHGYSTPRPDAVLASADMAGNVIEWLDDVSQFNKPYLMAEFGLQRDRMDVRALCDRDREGVHMHAGMWAALAHGAAGTAQLWWWGQYIDPKNLYYHFQAVANFVKDIPWTRAGFVRAEIQTAEENLRALGLRGNPVSILWLQNKSHTWWNVINGNSIPALEPMDLMLTGFTSGHYRVEYWNTYDGRIISTADASATDGTLKLGLPRIETDIAVKILQR